MSNVRTICPTCVHAHHWSWEEAFDKFGFGDGDDLVLTETVADALRVRGYTVTVTQWGIHNAIITDIERDGIALIPDTATRGYDELREHLPKEVIAILDREFREGQRIDY